jgi:hypothetical protein
MSLRGDPTLYPEQLKFRHSQIKGSFMGRKQMSIKDFLSKSTSSAQKPIVKKKVKKIKKISERTNSQTLLLIDQFRNS